jgi:hypothetical protein
MTTAVTSVMVGRWIRAPVGVGATCSHNSRPGLCIALTAHVVRSVDWSQYLKRWVWGGSARRQLNLRIVLNHAGFGTKNYSQTHHRGSDCKTDVLVHFEPPIGRYEDSTRPSTLAEFNGHAEGS